MVTRESELAAVDKIPYDAPLSVIPPTKAWIKTKSGLQGNRTQILTEQEVPGTDLTNKWVIISGSNHGIGREAALSFAKWGANIILACRDAPAKEIHPTVVVEECIANATWAGHQSQIEWWEIDMASLDSVEAFAKRWLDTGRALDILCNNAGMGSSPAGDKVFKTRDGFEIIHQVNFLSHVLLTLRLLPSLAKASLPRIVCTTSCFHALGVYDISNFNGGPGLSGPEGVQYYQNNKLYFQIWLTELQHRLLRHDEYRHITVNGHHPGYVNSGIWNLNQPGAWLRMMVVKTLAFVFAINSQQGAQGILYLATSPECGPDAKTQGIVGDDVGGKGGGRYFNRIWEEEPMPHCHDQDARLRVWRKVNDELGLKEKGLLDILGLYSIE